MTSFPVIELPISYQHPSMTSRISLPGQNHGLYITHSHHKITFSQKAVAPAFWLFCCRELEFGAMTLISGLDLHITKLPQCAEHGFCWSKHSRFVAQSVLKTDTFFDYDSMTFIHELKV